MNFITILQRRKNRPDYQWTIWGNHLNIRYQHDDFETRYNLTQEVMKKSTFLLLNMLLYMIMV